MHGNWERAEVGITSQLGSQGPPNFGGYSPLVASLVALPIINTPFFHIVFCYLSMNKFHGLLCKNQDYIQEKFFSVTWWREL